MNFDAVLGLVRHALTFGGGYLVAQGLATNDDVTTWVAGIAAAIGVAWSIYQKLQPK